MTWPEMVSVFARLERGESVCLATNHANPDLPSSVPCPPSAGPGPSLGLTSSGSTGTPKTVWKSWAGLKASASTSPTVRGWNWATPFQPSSFAGVQVAVQAWVGGGTVIPLTGDWEQIWDTLHRERPEAISATPTFFDLLLQTEENHEIREVGEDGAKRTDGPIAWQPRQVTIGGEPLRPGLGERLKARWPETHFTVIYASAEFGVLFKTHRVDGWYEFVFLGRRWEDHEIRPSSPVLLQGAEDGGRRTEGEGAVRGTLWLCHEGEWRSTGDEVEVAGDLVRVVGRADNVANVAGTKVSLGDVTSLAEQVPGIRRALAVAEPNDVTGQIVCLKFALDDLVDESETTARLQHDLRKHLPKEAWPRRWVVDAVEPTTNAKRG